MQGVVVRRGRRPAQSDAERRPPQDHAEAARRAQGRRSTPSSSGCRHGSAPFPASPCIFQPVQDVQICDAHRAARSTSTRWSAATPTRSPTWSSEADRALRTLAGAARSGQRSPGRRPARRSSTSTARRPGRLGITMQASTTRLTTPSASGRSRPSTPRPTSIASCWRRRRSTSSDPSAPVARLHVPLDERRAGAADASVATIEFDAPPRSPISHQDQFPARHHQLQPGARRIAERCGVAPSRRPSARSACRRQSRAATSGDAAEFSKSLARPALADPRRRRSPSTSCSACSTKASSTRSRS